MWELILKADVEFFSKDAAKKRPDMLGYYDIATDTIYLNHFTVFKELKERQHYTKPSVERREKKKLRLRRIKANKESF